MSQNTKEEEKEKVEEEEKGEEEKEKGESVNVMENVVVKKEKEFHPMKVVNEITKKLLANQKYSELTKEREKGKKTKEKGKKKMTLKTNRFSLRQEEEKNEKKKLSLMKKQLKFYQLRFVDLVLTLIMKTIRTKEEEKEIQSQTTPEEQEADWTRFIPKDVTNSFESLVMSSVHFFQQCDYYGICQGSTGGSPEIMPASPVKDSFFSSLLSDCSSSSSTSFQNFVTSFSSSPLLSVSPSPSLSLSPSSELLQKKERKNEDLEQKTQKQEKEEKEEQKEEEKEDEEGGEEEGMKVLEMNPQIKEINLRNPKFRSNNLHFHHQFVKYSKK